MDTIFVIFRMYRYISLKKKKKKINFWYLFQFSSRCKLKLHDDQSVDEPIPRRIINSKVKIEKYCMFFYEHQFNFPLF